MRIRVAPFFAFLAVLLLSCPVWAHSESTPLTLMQPATIGNMTLKPGQYRFFADLNTDQVRVERNGKVVGTFTGKPVMLHSKSEQTAIVFNGRRISELQFTGKTEAIKLD
jgi:hypothetical protein